MKKNKKFLKHHQTQVFKKRSEVLVVKLTENTDVAKG